MNLLERIKRRLGWLDCPECGALVRFRFEQVILALPEEPPLLGRYYCPACGYRTRISHLPMLDEGARAHGYKDFYDWMEKHTPKG
jgi:ribosomal protein S27AE